MPSGKCHWGIISHDNSQASKLIIVQLDFIFTHCCLSLLMILSLADCSFLKIRGSVCVSSKFPLPHLAQYKVYGAQHLGIYASQLMLQLKQLGSWHLKWFAKASGLSSEEAWATTQVLFHLSSSHRDMLTQLMSQVCSDLGLCQAPIGSQYSLSWVATAWYFPISLTEKGWIVI